MKHIQSINNNVYIELNKSGKMFDLSSFPSQPLL